MTSVVSICNMALSHVGKPDIADINEASVEARTCRRFYDHSRDTLLAAYVWRFAGVTLSLAEVTNDKPGVWEYAYARPGDCLKVRLIRPEYSTLDPQPDGIAGTSCQHPYDIEGETIYCSLSPAFLRYTRRIEDPTRFPPLFVEALTWQLAARLALPMTKDPKIRQACFDAGRSMQGVAEAADANEVRETSDHVSEMVTGRE